SLRLVIKRLRMRPISLLAVLLLASGACAARLASSEEGFIASTRKVTYGQLTPEAAADKINSLPGFQNALPSSHFGGYVTVDPARGRRLYYYFVESERDPANDPVVLWLNGGPGCSSFDGFVYEHGPFTYQLTHGPAGPGGEGGRGLSVQLRSNPFAWNKVANMLFLDSPAGVGMSYSGHAGDYEVDDDRTAADADAFLRGWFARFPQFGDNDFYVSGESYAGIYVPNLVRQVLLGNEAGERPHVNIVGYLVGNGCTDERYDGNAHPPFAAGKSLLPWADFRRLEAECGGEYWNRSAGSSCDRLWRQLTPNLQALNVYDTLQYCFHAAGAGAATEGQQGGRAVAAADPRAERRNRVLRRALGYQHQQQQQQEQEEAEAVPMSTQTTITTATTRTSSSSRLAAAAAAAGLEGVWPLPGGVVRPGPVLNWAHVAGRLAAAAGGPAAEGQGRLGVTPPCTDSRSCGGAGQGTDPGPRVSTPPPRPPLSHSPPCTDSRAADLWLNDPSVRAAIHAAPASSIGPWTLCSDKISYTRTHGSMIPIHVNNTRRHGLRALIYSGDHDMAVPHTGSEAWTAELGYEVEAGWRPWFVADEQVAGYVVRYVHGLSYATVKGAGHMVPETNPREAFAMFQRFIDGEPLA
ncbi:hypothetical protein Agub_g11267, partial [Astrephomene gubernaculifera]